MMSKCSLVAHAATSVVVAAVLGLLTYGYIVLAEGPVFSFQRGFVLGGAYVEAHIYHIVLLVGLTVLVMCGGRVAELAGWRTPRPGIALSANLFAGLVWFALLLLALRFEVWEAMLPGSDEGPTLRTDAELEYPELPLPPETEPPPWRMTRMNGESFTIDDLRGKAVFVNIWATWCGWCIYEFPSIEELYASLKENPDVAFVIVSDEDPEIVEAWLEENDYDLPFVVTEGFPMKFAPRGYPTTFFVAPDGRIAFRHSGALDWNGDKTRAFLTELAAAPSMD